MTKTDIAVKNDEFHIKINAKPKYLQGFSSFFLPDLANSACEYLATWLKISSSMVGKPDSILVVVEDGMDGRFMPMSMGAAE